MIKNHHAYFCLCIFQMNHIEDTVYRELLDNRQVEVKQSAMLPMESIDNYTRGAFSSSEWLESLNKQASATGWPTFLARDPVVLRDTGLLTGLRRIWARHSEAKLLEALAWLLAQILGPIADARLLRFRYANLATTNIRRVHFCVREVEEIYRFLVIALATVVNFRESLRLNISSQLAIVQQVAGALVGALPWLDNATKVASGKKIARAETLLWPPNDFVTDDVLSVMYSGFPEDVLSADETFADLWLQSRQALSDLVTDRSYEATAIDMLANTRLPLAQYDYVRNTVRISVQALSAPLYYPQGTNAMFYGGLGFVYARELVKSLDGEGVTFDADGNVGLDWSSDVWKITMVERTFCLAAQSGSAEKRAPKAKHNRLFPDIPALEVAYAALQWALALDPHPTRVLEQYTEQQLFFITLCYLMCGAAHPGARNCNNALRHFPPFAQHFDCAQGSGMKAAKPCSLLYIPNRKSDSD
ncbi:endothelin-converting enzyme 1 [Rhipicephalus microplus]|uniref:endothelin-converting enzyme 1 n=1 Tax=Rhipicephalus microplus TaxID=6941 RepID=UPI003F6C0FA2